MAKINLEKLSLPELKALGKDIDKAIVAKEKAKKAEALKAASEAAAKHGFELSDLVGKPKVKAAKAKAPAKYAHPENSAMTWSGRGRQPAWIKEGLKKGKALETFLIK